LLFAFVKALHYSRSPWY
jgi:hypothetical protein